MSTAEAWLTWEFLALVGQSQLSVCYVIILLVGCLVSFRICWASETHACLLPGGWVELGLVAVTVFKTESKLKYGSPWGPNANCFNCPLTVHSKYLIQQTEGLATCLEVEAVVTAVLPGFQKVVGVGFLFVCSASSLFPPRSSSYQEGSITGYLLVTFQLWALPVGALVSGTCAARCSADLNLMLCLTLMVLTLQS